MKAEQVVKYYLDNEGEELENPEEVGKGVELNGVIYREGENLRATIVNGGGTAFAGIMSKPTKKGIIKRTNLALTNSFALSDRSFRISSLCMK